MYTNALYLLREYLLPVTWNRPRKNCLCNIIYYNITYIYIYTNNICNILFIIYMINMVWVNVIKYNT